MSRAKDKDELLALKRVQDVEAVSKNLLVKSLRKPLDAIDILFVQFHLMFRCGCSFV